MAAEVLVNFSEPIRSKSGDLYYGRVLGRLADDGLWEGWVEFVLAGSDEVVKTRRETEQPTHADLRYWALGLTMTFLEGALDRALHPAATRMVTEKRIIVDSAPRRDAPRVPVASRRIVLDPFQTYAQGEDLLRSQLLALSHDDLQNIIETYGFAGDEDAQRLRAAPESVLAERIVERVRSRYASPAAEGTGKADIGSRGPDPDARA